MPEVIIKYKKPETLKILKGLAKYFDFTVDTAKSKKASQFDDLLIQGDRTINISDLEEAFTIVG